MKQMSFVRLTLTLFFAAAGVMHFARPEFYTKIMPAGVPFPLELVLISGFFEILLGGMVLFDKTRRLAGWGLIALLIAVFPANLFMALNPGVFEGIPSWALWARLPFQGIFIVWVWRVCLAKKRILAR